MRRPDFPTPAVIETLCRLPGNVIIIGGGGKMGPSLVWAMTIPPVE